MTVEELTRRSRQLVLRDPRLLADVSSKSWPIRLIAPLKAWVKWWRKWPLEHLAGEGFALSDDRFAVQRRVDSADAQVLPICSTNSSIGVLPAICRPGACPRAEVLWFR